MIHLFHTCNNLYIVIQSSGYEKIILSKKEVATSSFSFEEVPVLEKVLFKELEMN